jgi:hypothetical protein
VPVGVKGFPILSRELMTQLAEGMAAMGHGYTTLHTRSPGVDTVRVHVSVCVCKH